MRSLLLIALLAFAAPVFAQEGDPVVEVGDEVVDFDSHSWINPPLYRSFQELKGDVILIKAWGLN